MFAQLPERYRIGVKRTRDELRNARHLPGDFYTSTDIQAPERTEIFDRNWLCVGRKEEFLNPGDYRALDIAGDPIVVCRSKAGALRAVYNVCRHGYCT